MPFNTGIPARALAAKPGVLPFCSALRIRWQAGYTDARGQAQCCRIERVTVRAVLTPG